MVGKSISQEFRLENIGETRSHFPEEIEQKELMSKKYKKVYNSTLYWTLSYFSLYNYKLRSVWLNGWEFI